MNLATNSNTPAISTHAVSIPPKPSEFSSSANGGELLFLALATCYCNDIYREAAKRGIEVEQVGVELEGQFEAEGEDASNIAYRVKIVTTQAKPRPRNWDNTDIVAEIQNTLRVQTPVTLVHIEAVAAETWPAAAMRLTAFP